MSQSAVGVSSSADGVFWRAKGIGRGGGPKYPLAPKSFDLGGDAFAPARIAGYESEGAPQAQSM